MENKVPMWKIINMGMREKKTFALNILLEAFKVKWLIGKKKKRKHSSHKICDVTENNMITIVVVRPNKFQMILVYVNIRKENPER